MGRKRIANSYTEQTKSGEINTEWKTKKKNKKWGEKSRAAQIESALPWVPVAGNDLWKGDEGDREVGRSIQDTCGR